MRRSARRFGKPLQVERPALITADAGGQALPAFAVPFEMTVFQSDPCPSLAFGDETNLHFA